MLVKNEGEHIINKRWLNISDTAGFLGVSQDTLRRWEHKGKLIPRRTVGGHRRYSRQQLERILRQPLQKSYKTYSEIEEKIAPVAQKAAIVEPIPKQNLNTIKIQSNITKENQINQQTTTIPQNNPPLTPVPQVPQTIDIAQSPKAANPLLNLLNTTKNNFLSIAVIFLILVLLLASFLLLKQLNSQSKTQFLTPVPSFKQIN